jgi:hypothetical protein
VDITGLAGLVLGQLLTILSVAALIVGVHRVFLIQKELAEIKEILRSGRRSLGEPAGTAHASLATDYTAEVDDHAATAYAENLLRAMKTDTQQSPTQAQ